MKRSHNNCSTSFWRQNERTTYRNRNPGFPEQTWHDILPSDRLFADPRNGITRRHHEDPGGLQWAVKATASLARIPKPIQPACYITLKLHPPACAGYDTQHMRILAGVRTVQELHGHKDVKTTMIYPNVLNRSPNAVRSPLD